MTLSQAWLDGKTIKLLLLWQEGELDDVSDLRWGFKESIYYIFVLLILFSAILNGR